MLHLNPVIRNRISVFYLLFLSLALSLGPWAPLANATNVTIGWDSNPEPDLEGYVVYRNTGSPGPPYGYSNDLPEDELSDPLHPKITLTGLSDNKEYYVALTAYNTEGDESSFSNNVCVEVVNGIVELCSASASPGGSAVSSSGSGGGGGCFISTASHESSRFSEFIAKPVIRSQVLAMVFLLLILIAAVKFGFNKLKKNRTDS